MSRLRRTAEIELRDLRLAGGAMLAAGFLLPLLPGPDGVACPLRRLTGVPCPLCGLTTGVEETMHADIASALAANPFGLVAVLAAVALLAFRPPRLQVSVPLVLLAAVASWIFQLHRFSLV